MAKILQGTDTFLLHHTPPTRTPKTKELFQTVFKGSSSLCQLPLSQAGKGGGSTLLYAVPRRVGHKMGMSLKPKKVISYNNNFFFLKLKFTIL